MGTSSNHLCTAVGQSLMRTFGLIKFAWTLLMAWWNKNVTMNGVPVNHTRVVGIRVHDMVSDHQLEGEKKISRSQVYLVDLLIQGTAVCMPVRLSSTRASPFVTYGTCAQGGLDASVTSRVRGLTSWEIPDWNPAWAFSTLSIGNSNQKPATVLYETVSFLDGLSNTKAVETVRSAYWSSHTKSSDLN